MANFTLKHWNGKSHNPAARLAVILLLLSSFICGYSPSAEPVPAANNEQTMAPDPLPAGAVGRLGSLRFRQPAKRPGPSVFFEPITNNDTISAVAFSHNGKIHATAGGFGGISLWDAATGKQIAKLEVPDLFIEGIVFSPDDKQIAWFRTQGLQQVGICDIGSGKVLWQDTDTGYLGPIAYMPNGKELAVTAGVYGYPQLLDVATGKPTRSFAFAEKGWDPRGYVFLPDYKTLITRHVKFLGGKDFKYKTIVWDVASQKPQVVTDDQLNRPYPSSQYSGGQTVFSPDGLRVYENHGDSLRFRERVSGKEYYTFQGKPPAQRIRCIALSPDGKMLAFSVSENHPDFGVDAKTTVHLLDTTTCQEIHKFEGNARIAGPLVFSPDGKTLASGGLGSAPRLWKVSTGETLADFEGHRLGVSFLRFTKEGKELVSSDNALDVRWWDVARGTQTGKFELTSLTRVDVVPDGQVLATLDYNLVVQKPSAGTPMWETREQARACFRVSPDGNLLARAIYKGPIELFDTQTGKVQAKLEGQFQVYCLEFSANGLRMLSAARPLGRIGKPPPGVQPPSDHTVRVWDTAKGQAIRVFNLTAACAALSPNGQTVAVVTNDGRLSLWDVATGDKLRDVRSPRDMIRTLAFSADNSTLASGSDDGVVRLWEVATGNERGQFSGHNGPVLSLAFDRRGDVLASGSADTTVLLWDLRKPLAR